MKIIRTWPDETIRLAKKEPEGELKGIEGSVNFSCDNDFLCLLSFQESVSSKDVLDVKLEMLLRQWNKSIDILFTIHPVDGSLITWLV